MKLHSICLVILLVVKPAFSQDPDFYIDKTYELHKARGIINYLASDELGGRDTPSEGLEIAAKYIGHHFEGYDIKPAPGSDSYFQPVRLFKRQQPDSVVVQIGEKIISNSGNTVYLSGNSGLSRAACQWLDSSALSMVNPNFSHKIVLFFIEKAPGRNPRGILEQTSRIKAFAQAHRAEGFIEIFEKDHPLWERFMGYYQRKSIELVTSDREFMHIIMHDEAGTLHAAKEEVPEADILTYLAGTISEEFTSDNVIGMVEGSDPLLKNEYIVCTAHYDHVGIGRPDATGDSIYNGARDNAIGVMSVMMAAENLARFPAKRSVIFVLLTGEEKGLLGSQHFVKNPPVELDEIIFCLNSDGGGYNDSTIATVIGKRRLDTHHIFERACEVNQLHAFEGTDNTQFLFYNSDNAVFSREGIPSVTFSPGFREMDAEILKYYHQPSDESESLNFTYLIKFARSFGTALRYMADSTDRVFWKQGDELYEKGKYLYKQ